MVTAPRFYPRWRSIPDSKARSRQLSIKSSVVLTFKITKRCIVVKEFGFLLGFVNEDTCVEDEFILLRDATSGEAAIYLRALHFI